MRTGIAHLPLHGGRAPRWLLAAELIYGTPASTRDPARFSFAHGGKDGHPFPVDRETYDRTIDVLRQSLDRSRLDHTDKVAALERLATFSARPEASSNGTDHRDEAVQ